MGLGEVLEGRDEALTQGTVVQRGQGVGEDLEPVTIMQFKDAGRQPGRGMVAQVTREVADAQPVVGLTRSLRMEGAQFLPAAIPLAISAGHPQQVGGVKTR